MFGIIPHGVLLRFSMFFRRKLVLYKKPSWVIRKAFRGTMAANYPSEYLIWMDLEMTGLNQNVHRILEVACIVTNMNLEQIGGGINVVVHQPKEIHDESNPWSLNQHQMSGLRDASINSDISIEEADRQIFNYIKICVGVNVGKLYLTGNTVYMDKLFINKYMPLVSSLLHYRIVDVTSIKVLYKNWHSQEIAWKKSVNHRAFPDAMGSIQELKLYREKFFNINETKN